MLGLCAPLIVRKLTNTSTPACRYEARLAEAHATARAEQQLQDEQEQAAARQPVAGAQEAHRADIDDGVALASVAPGNGDAEGHAGAAAGDTDTAMDDVQHIAVKEEGSEAEGELGAAAAAQRQEHADNALLLPAAQGAAAAALAAEDWVGVGGSLEWAQPEAVGDAVTATGGDGGVIQGDDLQMQGASTGQSAGPSIGSPHGDDDAEESLEENANEPGARVAIKDEEPDEGNRGTQARSSSGARSGAVPSKAGVSAPVPRSWRTTATAATAAVGGSGQCAGKTKAQLQAKGRPSRRAALSSSSSSEGDSGSDGRDDDDAEEQENEKEADKHSANQSPPPVDNSDVSQQATDQDTGGRRGGARGSVGASTAASRRVQAGGGQKVRASAGQGLDTDAGVSGQHAGPQALAGHLQALSLGQVSRKENARTSNSVICCHSTPFISCLCGWLGGWHIYSSVHIY